MPQRDRTVRIEARVGMPSGGSGCRQNHESGTRLRGGRLSDIRSGNTGLTVLSRLSWLLAGLSLMGSVSRAEAKVGRVAVWRIDALGGVSPDMGASLESILTQELGLLAEEIVPSVKTLSFQKRHRKYASCQGEASCLARIGRALGAQYVVSGTLASVGHHYVVTLKLVRSATGRMVRRFTQPLTGDPNKLIEAVRLAAYRLLAPDKLLGNLQVFVDRKGARVFVDGNLVGTTPLAAAIRNLKVGSHTIKVTHPDYLPFTKRVVVRFEKTTIVRIHLVRPKVSVVHLKGGTVVRDHPVPFYGKWWFWTAVTVGAAALGALAGWAIGTKLRPRTLPIYVCGENGCVQKGVQ